MNPTDFASAKPSAIHRPARRPRPSIQHNATQQSRDLAPQGVITQAESILRDRALERRKSRAPFSELHANGGNSFGRQDSPDPQITLALRTMRDLNINDTTTHLVNPHAHDSTQSTNLDFQRLASSSLASRPVARRPVSAILAERLAVTSGYGDRMVGAGDKTQALLKREARRRTIYVPDDTTVMTIHPGGSLMSSTSSNEKSSLAAQRAMRRGSMLQKELPRRRRSILPSNVDAYQPHVAVDDTCQLQLPILDENPVIIDAEVERKNRRRSLAVAPKRVKMARDAGLPTLSEISEAGPKAQSTNGDQMSKPSRPPLVSNRSLQNVNLDPKHPLITIGGKEAAQRKPARLSISVGHRRQTSIGNTHTPLEEKLNNIIKASKTATVKESSPKNGHARSRSHNIASTNASVSNPPKASFRDWMKSSKPANDAFSVIPDDFAQPELYQDKWFENQETALTELLNAFFQATDPDYGKQLSQAALQSIFLKSYNTTDMLHLSKRLQASLIYGSLTVPKELLARSIRLKDDVGQRRKFLGLFLDVYQHNYLQAAAEAIAGRQCTPRNRTSTESVSSDCGGGEVMSRRSLEAFFDSFFIQHSDVAETKMNENTIAAFARDSADQVGSPMWSWRRTVIRSLMLILLLDKAKAEKTLPGCLFLESSTFKSSDSVIKELGTILLPSYGDLMRPLRHLNYEVSVQQYLLEEFRYKVDNIATDLRDGIRLTRLAEIILAEYNTNKDTPASEDQNLLPVLNVNMSGNLKYPCISRTQKLHNAMVGLSALVHLPNIPEQVLKDVTAYDIVDGHREKTLTLLWSLLAPFSCRSLVDWSLLKQEIKRAQHQLAIKSVEHVIVTDVDSIPTTTLASCHSLLYIWAQSICALQNHQITNFTTSFASGTAFSAIFAHYTPYLPIITHSPNPSHAALRALGCSKAYIVLLTSHSTIPTKITTLATLTYLATNLPPLSRRVRAATTIQSVYRGILARQELQKRMICANLAHHCAVVVTARERVVNAAMVLQRGWRVVLNRRRQKLDMDVLMFQVVARGFLARERARKANGKGTTRLVRAGW